MKIKTYGQLKATVAQALKEINVSANAGAYNTPKAFKKTGKPFEIETSRPKRPSHTKMFDFK